jgi:hypothetical protein
VVARARGEATPRSMTRGKAGGETNRPITGRCSFSPTTPDLAAGLIDELQIHVVPQLHGDGERLFENLGGELPALEAIRVIESPKVTHLKSRSERSRGEDYQ